MEPIFSKLFKVQLYPFLAYINLFQGVYFKFLTIICIMNIQAFETGTIEKWQSILITISFYDDQRIFVILVDCMLNISVSV